jgi:hypothetical protein
MARLGRAKDKSSLCEAVTSHVETRASHSNLFEAKGVLMKTEQVAYRPGVVVVAVGLASLLLLQGCYVKWDDETIIGQEDTAFPGASVERGCVVEIERGERSFPPDYKVLFQKPDSHARFTRHAGASSKLEVGKCYEWKLGFRDPSLEDISKEGLEAASKEIASDTVRALDP